MKAAESVMAEEATYTDQTKLQAASKQYDALKSELDGLQQQWEQLAEEIMAMED